MIEKIKINNKVNTKITFIYGPMYSGKSKKLIKIIEDYRKNNKNISILKPVTDTRNGNFLFSRFDYKKKLECCMVKTARDGIQYINNSDVIAIDEYQFFEKNELEGILKYIVDNKKTLIIAGLDMDSNKNYWENFNIVKQLSKKEIHLYAICNCCKSNNAEFSFLEKKYEIKCDEKIENNNKTESKKQNNIQIESENNKYLALCIKCFDEKLFNKNKSIIE